MNVAIIAVHAAHGNAGQRRKRAVCVIQSFRRDAGAVHAHVHVHEHGGRPLPRERRLSQKGACVEIVGQRVQMNARKFLHQRKKPLDVRPNDRIRPQAVRRARFAGEPQLLAGGALEAMNAHGQLYFQHLRHLVRFDVRPETLRVAGHPNSETRIGLDRISVVNQRRGGNRVLTDKMIVHNALLRFQR